MVGAVRRSFKFLNSTIFTKLYKPLVRNHLESSVKYFSNLAGTEKGDKDGSRNERPEL